jgi:HEAT repeat protein
LLDDPSFAVRDRAIEELALRGEAALPVLQKALSSSRSPRLCRNAVWALTRIEHAEARAIVRSVLNAKDLSVKLAALHSVGLYRDSKALLALLTIVATDHPAAQRQAATALGRIRNPDAVGPIMEAVKQTSDRFLSTRLHHDRDRIEHAHRHEQAGLERLRDSSSERLSESQDALSHASYLGLDDRQ